MNPKIWDVTNWHKMHKDALPGPTSAERDESYPTYGTVPAAGLVLTVTVTVTLPLLPVYPVHPATVFDNNYFSEEWWATGGWRRHKT